MNPVTDPALLAQLNGPGNPVTDPAILAQLNGHHDSFASSIPGRALTGAMDPVYGTGQIVPRALSKLTSVGGLFPNTVSKLYDQSAHTVDAAENTREANYQKARDDAGQSGFDWARLAGNIISPANAAVGNTAGLMPEVTSLSGKMAQGLAMGLGYGATTPVNTTDKDYASQKTGQMVTGGAAGLAAPLLGHIIGNAVYPNIGDEQKLLLDEGVRLTPGQIIGGNAKAAEDKATSIPILGGMIKNAQNQSIEDLNTAVANRALSPIGKELPENFAGRDAVDYVKQTLGGAYDNLLPKLTGKNDAQFQQELSTIQGMAQHLPQQEQNALNGIIEREITNRMSGNGSMTGDSLKEIEGALGREAGSFTKSPDAYQQQVGGALKETQAALRRMIERNNPQHADELQKINEGYANYARMRQAASYLGANDGVFSPAQLSSAVRGADKTVGKGGYATGNAYMQDLSDAAKEVLPQKYQDSGTPGRLAMMEALLGAGGAAHFGHPALAAGGVGAAGLYSRPGQAMARMLMTKRPQALAPVGAAITNYSNPAALARLLLMQ